ncbi:MAG TPA: hypothetical protein VFS43_18400 [Polyangiaceae bacterium]|nr:hypothetical protein [Polyangiaceae bacterium]
MPLATRLCSLWFVAALAAPGCAASPPAFVATAREAPGLTVYRGVPRWAQPPADGSTFAIAGQKFFREPKSLRGAEARALAEALADDANYTKHVEGKRCGGFHADWAVEWQRGGEPQRVLLCFGCGEAMSLSGGGTWLNDLSEGAEAKLTSILGPQAGPPPAGAALGAP